jgi:hypothetical protein
MRRPAEYEYAVDVVRHDDEGVEHEGERMHGCLAPAFVAISAIFVR